MAKVDLVTRGSDRGNPLKIVWNRFSALDTFTKSLVVCLVLLVLAIPFIASQKLNSTRQQAAGLLTFVDASGNPITQTTSPSVNVLLTSPWPAALAMVPPRHHGLFVAQQIKSVAGASAYTIYDDSLENGWTDGSYRSSINYNNTSPVYSGTRSISAILRNGGGLGFASPTHFSSSPYTQVQFAIHASQPNEDLLIYADNANYNNLGPSLRLYNYGGYPSTTGWTIYTIPLSDLHASGKILGDITIDNNTNSTLPVFYVDQVQLINTSTSPTPTTQITLSPSPSASPTLSPSPSVSASPSLSPSLSPSPSPAPVTTSVTLAEDAAFTTNVKTISPYTANPFTTAYTFSNTTLGTKTLYVKFTASDGSTQTASNTIQLVSAATSTLTPTPGNMWKPTASAPIHFQWQLSAPLNPSTDMIANVAAYDVDGFDNTAATVTAIHAAGARAVCYIDVGTWENWRSDASSFPPSVLGNSNGWPGEKWLDIRQISILGPIMQARFQMCKDKGFDSIEGDNIDGYSNTTGFSLNAQDQITYNKYFASLAHSVGLSIALKNDPDQANTLQPYFDWALDEQCNQYNECSSFTPFTQNNKAVIEIEYKSSNLNCSQANSMKFNTYLRDINLTAPGSAGYVRTPCIPDAQNNW